MKLHDFLKWTLAAGCLLGSVFAMAQNATPPKIALLVAVGDYPAETGWQKINSANDVPVVKSALLQQGFKEENIHVLTNADATKAGILEAIQKNLEARAMPGSVAYFQFSGHGQQVADDNNEEIDGYDEALVPVNSPKQYQAGVYEGANLLRDDELGSALDKVRRKLGPSGNLLVLIDACHSGTGTRGFGIARGTTEKMADSTYQAKSRGMKSEAGSHLVKEEKELAPMVAFFGAAPNQLNFETTDQEGKGIGSLSYAFGKAFAKASSGNTYRGLFDQIKLEMSNSAPRQQPQAEGTLDQQILGGRLLGAPAYFSVKHWNDPGSVVIKAGWLQGVHNSSVIGLFPAETRDFRSATPISKGTVTGSRPLESTVTLETDVEQSVAAAAWAYVLEQNFGNLSLDVKIDLPEGNGLASVLDEKIGKLPIFKKSETPELIITEKQQNSRGAGTYLMTADDLVLDSMTQFVSPAVASERIVARMMAFVQAKFLRNLNVTNSELDLSFEIVPVKLDAASGEVVETIPISDKKDEFGNLRFREGDAIRIKVTNNGIKSAYFTLIDIQPDNKVNILIPNEREEPADFRLGGGESRELAHVFELYPPYGAEVFKLIATDQPMDLRNVVQSRGEQTKGVGGNPFEQLFSQTFNNSGMTTRGGKTMSVSVAKLNIHSVVFSIEKI